MAFGFSSGTYEKIADGVYRIRLDRGFSAARFASGLEKLAFEVLYCLFTTQGSIPTDPDFGTLLRAFIGQLSMGQDTSLVSAAVSGEVTKAANQIKSRQLDAKIPPEEKLKSLIIDSIEVLRQEQAVNINIIIVNELDQSVGLEIPEIGVTA